MSAEEMSTDMTQSYFLAEISMRRMLHRCNTAIRRAPNGKFLYAPAIALELEHQLDEWYNYLPAMIRFDTTGLHARPACNLANFLRVQYYCCKMSIYWPAVYEAIQDDNADKQLLDHCKRFFDSYVQLTPSILQAFQDCIVNRWTIYVR